MSKIIKANVMSRKASLLENTNQVSLFKQGQASCIGIYLLATQQFSYAVAKNETVILSVFQGSGELSCNGDATPLNVQIVVGDIVQITEGANFILANTSAEELIATLIVIKF